MLEPGELLGHLLSGGGGYGDPREREPERVREDVLSRFVGFERAREVYGVVFEREILDDSLDSRRARDGTPAERAMTRFPGFSLDGKVAMVTGASSGIGTAIAQALSDAGASVVLTGRDEERLRALRRACGEWHVVVADLAADDAPAKIVAETIDAFGAHERVVHSAGIFWPKPFADAPLEDFDEQFRVNVRGALRAHAGGAAASAAGRSRSSSSPRSPGRSASRARPPTARRRVRSS